MWAVGDNCSLLCCKSHVISSSLRTSRVLPPYCFLIRVISCINITTIIIKRGDVFYITPWWQMFVLRVTTPCVGPSGMEFPLPLPYIYNYYIVCSTLFNCHLKFCGRIMLIVNTLCPAWHRYSSSWYIVTQWCIM